VGKSRKWKAIKPGPCASGGSVFGKEGECSVIVRFAGTGLTDSNNQPTSSDILVTELTAPKSQKDADKVLDRIGHSLERKEAFTDLTRPGS
jgi:hypothetical protein